ncbi:MAG: endonuclease/exonuclease/phosphatase family protein [Candidatus Omnitrophica bacterium]|nr:endonuclease/exonuclease/phosphatase family protein [Candidatus Omnitrophota bacterium]
MTRSALIYITIVFTLTGFFSHLGWFFDLTSHFRLQYFILLLVLTFSFSLKKQWRLVIVSGLAAALNLIQIGPYYLPRTQARPPATQKKQSLSILLINLNAYNHQFRSVIEHIQEMKPDIIALEELTPKWQDTLAATLREYPDYAANIREDGFGIGLYSRVRMDTMNIRFLGEVEVPSVTADMTIRNEKVSLLFTHPLPPGNPKTYRARNQQLEHISSLRDQFHDKMILIGDLNTTSWSHAFKNFSKKMGLIDSRMGRGLQTTWPAPIPFVGITIDHILISPDIDVRERMIGPYIGSDHFPVYIQLRI